MNRAIQFLDQINKFTKENSLEEVDPLTSLYKFYIFNSGNPDFKEDIRKAVEDAYKDIQMGKFIDILEFATLMLELNPQKEEISIQQRNCLWNGGFSLLKSQFPPEALLSLLGKLLTPQRAMKMINEFFLSFSGPTRIQSGVKNRQKMILTLIKRKIEWQIEKKNLFLIIGDEGTFIIRSISANLTNLLSIKTPDLYDDKIDLLTMILRYRLDHEETFNKAHLVLRKMEQYNAQIQRLSLEYAMVSMNHNLKFNLIYLCMKVIGFKDRSWLSQFIMVNIKNHFSSASFLHLLNEILDLSSDRKILTKEVASAVMNKIIYVLLNLQNGEPYETYSIAKEMCIIMIKTSKLYLINYTNRIIKKIKDYHIKPLYQIFLSSLLLIYDLNSEIIPIKVDQITKLKPTITPFQANYNSFLKNFTNLNSIIEYLNLNIKERDEIILWELLTLRNTVTVNYAWLQQEEIVKDILLKLVKYVLFNLFPKESAEIIFIIIKMEHHQRHLKITRDELQNVFQCIPLTQTLIQINQICTERMLGYSTLESLELFDEIIQLMKKQYNLECIENLSLLSEVLKKVGFILTVEKRVDKALIPISIDLMKTVMPRNCDKIKEQYIKRCMEMICYLILTAKEDERFLEIYMELLFKCQDTSIVKNQDLYHHIESRTINVSNLYQRQRLEISHFLFNGSLYTSKINQVCWNLVEQALNKDEPEVCIFVQKIFKAFDEKGKEASIEQGSFQEYSHFIKKQLSQSLGFLQKLVMKLSQTVVTQRVVRSLQVLQSFQLYLITTIQNVEELKISLEDDLRNSMQKIFNDILRYLDSDNLISNLCRNNKIGIALKQLWTITYFLQLILIQKQLRVNSLPEDVVLRENQNILSKCSWGEKILRKNGARGKREYYLREIIEIEAVKTCRIAEIHHYY